MSGNQSLPSFITIIQIIYNAEKERDTVQAAADGENGQMSVWITFYFFIFVQFPLSSSVWATLELDQWNQWETFSLGRLLSRANEGNSKHQKEKKLTGNGRNDLQNL